jgi:Tol biopolymer transport system component
MKKRLVWSVVVLGGLAQSAWAGGQQVTAQPSADGKSVVVRTYRCGTPSSFTVVGTAEGVVDGARKTIPLAIARAGEEGVFTVARQWPADGKWVLVFSVEGGHAVSALVELEPGAAIRVARQTMTHGKPTPAAVHIALASAASSGSR